MRTRKHFKATAELIVADYKSERYSQELTRQRIWDTAAEFKSENPRFNIDKYVGYIFSKLQG